MNYSKITLSLFLLLLFAIISCTSIGTKDVSKRKQIDSSNIKDTLTHPGYNASIQKPEIDSVFNTTHQKEDFANAFMNQEMTLIFYATGKVLNHKDTISIMMHTNTDSTCLIELFRWHQNGWERGGTTVFPYTPFMANDFLVVVNDYNFDGMNDFFVRTLVTNGTAIDYGHLFTVSKTDLSITEHFTDERIGNIRTSTKTKEIFGKKLVWCGEEKDIASASSQKTYYKWVNDRFVVSRVDNPCE